MRYHEIIVETVMKLDLGNRDQRIWRDPTRRVLVNLLGRMPVMRGLADAHQVYVWDAEQAVHTMITEVIATDHPWSATDDYLDFYVASVLTDEFSGLEEYDTGAYSIYYNPVRGWNRGNRRLADLMQSDD